jgi:Caspase domain
VPCVDHCLSRGMLQKAYDYRCNRATGKRGRALIIANQSFTEPHLEYREGTDVDVQNLERLLHDLKFEVSVKKDLPAKVFICIGCELNLKHKWTRLAMLNCNYLKKRW